jgi:hypothetical protein
MKIGQSTQLWSLSSDSNEYGRNLNLLSGRLKNSLTPEGINEQTLRAGLSNLSVKDRVEVIHDGSDIRKPYSKLLPHLTKVKSLEKQMVNGYNTFNSIVINDLDKQIHLLASTPYSTSDPNYNQTIGAGFNQNDIIFGQITQTDEAIKTYFPELKLGIFLTEDTMTKIYLNSLTTWVVISLFELNRIEIPMNLQLIKKANYKLSN